MSEFQYKLVKFFMENFKLKPYELIETWGEYGVKLDIVELYRAKLTISYEVYKNDKTPAEDVMLAMEGLVK